MPRMEILPSILTLGLVLAGCVQQEQGEPVKVIEDTEQRVILEGLLDKSRPEPSERYTAIAQERCARHGSNAKLTDVTSIGTWASRMTYLCVK